MTDLAASALEFLQHTLVPSLRLMTKLLGPVPRVGLAWEDQAQARVLQTAFAGQESLWENVQQLGGGPGRGFFQFEPPTCGLILNNPVSRSRARLICQSAGVLATQEAVYECLLTHASEVAVPFARLDTFCDPRPLPPLNDPQAAWEIYLEEWRPGKPHPAKWGTVYQAALDADHAWVAMTSGKGS